jgi:hypothetical protein
MNSVDVFYYPLLNFESRSPLGEASRSPLRNSYLLNILHNIWERGEKAFE